jgi:hypothetical protein
VWPFQTLIVPKVCSMVLRRTVMALSASSRFCNRFNDAVALPSMHAPLLAGRALRLQTTGTAFVGPVAVQRLAFIEACEPVGEALSSRLHTWLARWRAFDVTRRYEWQSARLFRCIRTPAS